MWMEGEANPILEGAFYLEYLRYTKPKHNLGPLFTDEINWHHVR
jgi:hypothetical protein